MPQRSLVQSPKVADTRWNLLQWMFKNADESPVRIGAILRDAGLRMGTTTLYNELAFLCHCRQLTMRKTATPNVFRYQFYSFEADPIQPLIMDPNMTVDDFLALVSMPFTGNYPNYTDNHDADSEEDDDDMMRGKFTAFAHPFITGVTDEGRSCFLAL